jgi:hypothetical protein
MQDLKNDPCGNPITVEFLLNCDEPPVAGIEQKVILINVEDVETITEDAVRPNSLITGLALASGKTGYMVEGVKRVLLFSNTFDAPENVQNGMLHSLTLTIYDVSVEARAAINKMVKGSMLHAVVERKNKGVDNDDAFLFFGQEQGLVLSDITDNSNENDGAMVITLSTPAGLREPNLPKVLLETDYATTLTAFNNKFAS